MKVNISIDCTPEEARRFFGLPDVSALQEEFLAEMSNKMREAAGNMDAEAVLQQWMTSGMAAGLKGFEQFQDMFRPFMKENGNGPGGKA